LTVEVEKEAGAFVIYPNPLKSDVLNLAFEIKEPGELKVETFSVDGKHLHLEEFFPEAGRQTITLGLPALQSGIYLLKITHRGAVSTVRFFRG
jgi:hypothetical protein